MKRRFSEQSEFLLGFAILRLILKITENLPKFCCLVHFQSIKLILWSVGFDTLELEHCIPTDALLYPFAKGYNGGIIARRLSLTTATQMFHREGLEMFWVLWYNGSSKKATSVSEQIARARWEKIWSLDSDHNLDHIRFRTTWKQCLKEHTKAVISD